MTSKYTIAFVVGLFLVNINVGAEEVKPATTERVAAFEVRDDRNCPDVCSVVKVYPSDEIYFGDTVYIVRIDENRSEKTIHEWAIDFPGANEVSGKIVSDEISGGYRVVPKHGDELWWEVDLAQITCALQPNKKIVTSCRFMEFPPLEEWSAPFWRELRQKLRDKSDGISCKLRMANNYVDIGRAKPREDFEVNIVVKPRLDGEMERLQRWLSSPPIKSSQTFASVSGQSDIEIDGKSYDPWLFVRVGNRKPSDPNNPTTVDGWRKLEAEFAPSTLRDEITLTRLQLEYYDADKGEASDAALKILVDWLSQRPEPQRVVLSQSLLSKRDQFKGTPLEAKNATLCDTLTSAFPAETPTTDDAK